MDTSFTRGTTKLGLILATLLSALWATIISERPQAEDWPSVDEARKIGEEGFIYGLPIVMNYSIMYEYAINKNSGQFKAPFNNLNNEARVFTYKDTTVVTPNSDTPYSMVWLDLRAEPLVISVPKINDKRYYSVQLNDGNTFNYGYIGSRATGNEAGNYLITGPDWKGEKPDSIDKVFTAGSDFSLAIFRTQLFSPDDMENVIKIQAGYKVQPLSSFAGMAKPEQAAKINFPAIDKQSMQSSFFKYLDFAMQFNAPFTDDREIRQKLARIGVGPDKKFSFDELPDDVQQAVMQGAKQGEQKVTEAVRSIGTRMNGWQISSPAGSQSFYSGNWLLRAAAASAGIYGNDAVEATYPMTRTDSEGNTLDGSKHKYTLTFAKGQLPPVNAFWSVTMYDGKNQLLIKNPIDRYLINSPMLSNMKKNEDGSVTIYIQKTSPGTDREANWLPAPDGPIYLVMRLYWPKTGDPSVLPPGKGSWKPPGIQVAD
ncbi:DUF1254 domain-containing protein [Microbulbifer elongatus]|uniref:DUF1254 domain-containing protein n=1 Tax=Microbulbifer elongatus TaxID=86173 RepID=UPI001CFEFF80|nr:DUF1254 domain-containing protein [Microbulbifer elongatus]